MPVVVVERTFPAPLSEPELRALGEKQIDCLRIYGVTWTQSLISNDHSRMVCMYNAVDTESVRKAQHESGVPFDRVWTGNIIK